MHISRCSVPLYDTSWFRLARGAASVFQVILQHPTHLAMGDTEQRCVTCDIPLSSCNVLHCSNGRREQDASTGVWRFQCCKCASLVVEDWCLGCIEDVRKTAARRKMEDAISGKRKASEALTAVEKDLEGAEQGLEDVKRRKADHEKKVQNSEEAKRRIQDLEEVDATLGLVISSHLQDLKRKSEEFDKEVAELQQRKQELSETKRRRTTEELEAAQVLDQLEGVLSARKPQESYPAYWSLKRGEDDVQGTELPPLDAEGCSFFQQLIRSCSHNPGSDGSDCNLSHMRDLEVTEVWRIENKNLWDVYVAKRKLLVTRLGADKRLGAGLPAVNPPFRTAGVSEFVKREKLEPRAGEAFLFHGAPSESAAMDIAERGFNRHFANSRGMNGSGCYFTDQSCKAAFYAHTEAQRKHGAAAVVLLNRVLMGHHFQIPTGEQGERDAARPPRKCGHEGDRCRCGEYYDSVVAHFNVTNNQVLHGLHREITVYDADMVYPEFMIFLRPLSGGSKGQSAGPSAMGGPSAASGSGGSAQVRRATMLGLMLDCGMQCVWWKPAADPCVGRYPAETMRNTGHTLLMQQVYWIALLMRV